MRQRRVAAKYLNMVKKPMDEKKLREQLERMYWKEKLSTREICAKLDIEMPTLYYYMNKLNIRRRTLSKATTLGMKKWWKKRKEVEKNVSCSRSKT